MNELINLKDAMEMSEGRLTVEIGKRSRFLKEEFGMNPKDSANFVASLLNLGVAMDKKFKENKNK